MENSLKLLMRCSASAVVIVGLSACANTSPAPMSNSPMTGPVNTGTYPHFTPDPKGETTQFTQQEKDDLRNRTNAAKNSQRGPSADPTAAARKQAEIRALRQQQEQDLKAIESGQQ